MSRSHLLLGRFIKMNMQEEQEKANKKPEEQQVKRPDTDQNTAGSVKENERSIPSDKEINLSDEDQALDSGI